MEHEQKAYRKVVDYFRKKIISEDYRVGDKLPPEREIAAELGIGRNSVREAIRVMDMMGIISSVQGSGNYITCDLKKSMAESMAMMFAMDQVDFTQISQVRASLEEKAYILAIKNASEEEISKMEGYVRELAVSGDDERSIILDEKLHYAMAAASKNVLIIDILDACSIVVHMFIGSMRKEIVQVSERFDVLKSSHLDMVAGLREKDVDRGVRALRAHFKLIDEVIEEKEKLLKMTTIL